MSKTKRDFKTLKLDFFTSDEMEVKPFIEKKLGKWKRNGTFTKNTSGRGKEKQEYLNNIFRKALEDTEKDIEERVRAKIIKVENLYFQLTLTLEDRLKNPENLTISDIYTIWKIIRTEKGLTTNITKDPQIEARAEQLKIEILSYKDPKTILNESDFIRD